MTTLHRVKAYFGMVPADELDSYDGYDDDRYATSVSRRDDRGTAPDRYGAAATPGPLRGRDRYEADAGTSATRATTVRTAVHDRYEVRPRRVARRTPRPRDPEVTEIRRDEAERSERSEHGDQASRSAVRGRSWAPPPGPATPPCGPARPPGCPPSLASASASGSASTTGGAAVFGVRRVARGRRPSPCRRPPRRPPRASRRRPGERAAEITSLQPKSYNEARLIGERYRDGIPVIMNLTEMDDAGAKRLVDFAAGLAFALRGSIEKVTNRVFLLSPPNVEVSASDRRKLAEKNYASTS